MIDLNDFKYAQPIYDFMEPRFNEFCSYLENHEDISLAEYVQYFYLEEFEIFLKEHSE